MLYDAKNLYSDAQAASTSAASSTVGSTNQIDHGPFDSGNSTHDLSRHGLWLNIRCTTALVSTGAATMAVLLRTADNTGMTSPSTVATVVAAAVASVGWTAGAEYNIPLPQYAYKRYTDLAFVGATHIITAGAITAALVDAPGRYQAFAQDAEVY